MSKKWYWNLLLLFGVLCKGIIGTISEKEIDESSDLLIRQKRVINLEPDKDVRVPIRHFPYSVAIKRFRVNEFCVGVILTHHTVLTIARCVDQHLSSYRVYSGCAQLSRTSHAVSHNITNKRVKIGNHPFKPNDGIALITITPPLNYCSNTHNIELYEGHVQPGFYGTVYGWGCNPSGPIGTAHPDWLRSIKVPIISNEDCNILHLHNFVVSDSDICTLDAFGQKYCGANDPGAPLVFNDRGTTKLVGILLLAGAILEQGPKPDVFVNLQHFNYKNWILENTYILEGHSNSPNVNQH